MSSDKPTVRRSRSPGTSTIPRTQSLRSSTANQPRSPPENLAPRPSANESQQEGICGPIGPPEPGKKSLDELNSEAQDHTDAALDPTSPKRGILPDHATTDEDKDEDSLNTVEYSFSTDTGPGDQIPPDGTETDIPIGNKDDAKKASNPQEPTPEKSWEVIMEEVTSLDEGLVGGWKDDIDTLLVFAGLFSAVVTAFTIESYQWLQEAPEDTTVALLRQISQQMNSTSVPEPDTFAVSSSDVAINVLWFLSLIIALVDALFALLCKQWLREHQRHTHTRTPDEALALRWLRNQSLEQWHVPTILASLPMLLELALFLFLAGLLELLRTRHPVPFTISTIVVAFAAIFYLGTTVIPVVDIVRQALQVTQVLKLERDSSKGFSPIYFIMMLPPMEYICPYKSPQAWVAFEGLRFLSRIFGPLGRAAWFLQDRGYITFFTYRRLVGRFTPTETFGQIISNLSSWSSVDLELLQRADIELAPPYYELNAFRWLVAELRDSPHMIPHLQKVLSTIPLHLVMPVVFDQWFFLPGRKWTVGDIGTALAPNHLRQGIDSHLTLAKEQFLSKGRETQLFNDLLHWIHVSMNSGDKRMDGGRDSPDPFPTPFRRIDANPNDEDLWDIYTKIAQDPAVPDYYWRTLFQDLAPYVIASSPDYALHLHTAKTTSPFVESADGCEFLSKIHSTIFERKLFEYSWKDINMGWKDDGIMGWMEAIDVLRRLELMTFVNNRLAEEPEILEWLQLFDQQSWTTQWRNTVERVKVAHPELPPDHFKDVSHEGVDSPVPDQHPSQQEVDVEAQAGDSGGSSRNATNAGEVKCDKMNGRSPNSATELSPQPEPEEANERRPLDDGDTNEKGSISRQPVVTASGSSGVQGEKMVGGPDADKNV
ncbi:hypothetical protein PQX77_018121 [Marasmius sp. AFHP31]|nr:hypothetical protein PQX77_018121 [Marasmius sp. AFHP31]